MPNKNFNKKIFFRICVGKTIVLSLVLLLFIGLRPFFTETSQYLKSNVLNLTTEQPTAEQNQPVSDTDDPLVKADLAIFLTSATELPENAVTENPFLDLSQTDYFFAAALALAETDYYAEIWPNPEVFEPFEAVTNCAAAQVLAASFALPVTDGLALTATEDESATTSPNLPEESSCAIAVNALAAAQVFVTENSAETGEDLTSQNFQPAEPISQDAFVTWLEQLKQN